MKITKPKANQLLFEDDCFKKLKLEVEAKTGLNKSIYNEDYEAFVLAYRIPNMDASKQVFYGDPFFIIALMTSCIENLIINQLISEKQLDEITNEIKKHVKRRNHKKWSKYV